jgi:signal peptidase II
MIYYLVSIGIVILDQLSKYLALEYLAVRDTLPLIEGVFHLTFRQNTGAAFSILRNNLNFLIGMTGIVILIMAYVLYRLVKEKNHWLMLLSLSFMFGGALGNFIDRIRLGYVVDYFDFRLINFAVFNVGDSFIVVGAILMGFYLVFLDGKQQKNTE